MDESKTLLQKTRDLINTKGEVCCPELAEVFSISIKSASNVLIRLKNNLEIQPTQRRVYNNRKVTWYKKREHLNKPEKKEGKQPYLKKGEARKRILKVLQKNPDGLKISVISKETKIKTTSVYIVVKKLSDDGEIIKVKNSKTDSVYYKLPDTPQQHSIALPHSDDVLTPVNPTPNTLPIDATNIFTAQESEKIIANFVKQNREYTIQIEENEKKIIEILRQMYML